MYSSLTTFARYNKQSEIEGGERERGEREMASLS